MFCAFPEVEVEAENAECGVQSIASEEKNAEYDVILN